jgi:hypothetical protein
LTQDFVFARHVALEARRDPEQAPHRGLTDQQSHGRIGRCRRAYAVQFDPLTGDEQDTVWPLYLTRDQCCEPSAFG